VTLRERNDPGHQPFWRNLHPAAAACGRILHYAVPHRAYYPYYCCLTPAAAVAPAAQRGQERAQRDSGGAAGITAWLSISGQGEGLVISVTLDDPASQVAHQEVLDAVQRAVAAVPAQGFPIDVTFPGENEPDQVDAWISAYAEPFYIRA
jgi:hypothetical protein